MSWYAAAAFGSSMAVVLGRYLRRTFQHRRERNEARRKLAQITAIADVRSEGTIARVTGFVKPVVGTSLLTSPLSDLECVAYRARVDGRTQPMLMPITRFELVPFSVDGIEIHADNAEFDVPPVLLEPSPEQRDRYDAFLQPYAVHRHHRMFAGGAVFDEVVITVGMRVTVIGAVMLAGIEAGGTYREAAHRWRLVGDREHPIVIGEAID
ncbi:MAG TPA: hypothetical protein VGO00_27165 [Kofleriaceae bacterium]|nr:hypothetical protein [Kofleriaceae bacterium]